MTVNLVIFTLFLDTACYIFDGMSVIVSAFMHKGLRAPMY